MARGTRKTITIDDKIKQAEADVFKARDRYDAAMAELERLVTKKREMEGKKLLKAFENSKRSLDEVLEYLSGDSDED